MTEEEYKKCVLDEISEKTLNTRMSEQILDYLRFRAKELGISYARYLRQIIADDMFNNKYPVKKKNKDKMYSEED